jgi:RNA polymerase sigma factor (sigma-70 family)
MREGIDFETFLDKLYPKMRAIAFKLNKGLRSLDEQDLVQEEVVFLWQHFAKGDFADKTESYILQACYFYLQNFIRSSKDRVKRISLDDGEEEEAGGLEEKLSAASDSGDFVDTLDSRLIVEIIRNNGLTDREKSFLPLFAEGLTTREIGRRMGISHVRVVKIKKEIGDKCRKYLDRHIR